MKWTEPKSPNDESHYDHVICETPLGSFIIEWKGWKEYDSYSVTLRNNNGFSQEYITDDYDLESAKETCYKYLVERYELLKTFLKL